MNVLSGPTLVYPGDQHAAALHRKVEEAKVGYKAAKVEYQRLMAIFKDASDRNDPAFADGNLALRQAIRVHFDARIEYQRALRDFTDFILTRKKHR